MIKVHTDLKRGRQESKKLAEGWLIQQILVRVFSLCWLFVGFLWRNIIQNIVKPYVNASETKSLLGQGLRHTAVCTGVLCGFIIPIHYKCISHLCIYARSTVIVSSLTDKQVGIGQ